MSTVTPPPAQSPDPGPTDAYDLAKWLFSEPIRALWGLVYLVACLAAIVLIVWLVAPHIGPILGTLVGVGAGAWGGGLGIGAARRRWGDRNDRDPNE